MFGQNAFGSLLCVAFAIAATAFLVLLFFRFALFRGLALVAHHIVKLSFEESVFHICALALAAIKAIGLAHSIKHFPPADFVSDARQGFAHVASLTPGKTEIARLFSRGCSVHYAAKGALAFVLCADCRVELASRRKLGCLLVKSILPCLRAHFGCAHILRHCAG